MILVISEVLKSQGSSPCSAEKEKSSACTRLLADQQLW